ncbi:MoaD/ThiS family protein [Neomoorella thermoacetica]|uniref:MoaD/ThiS family protein n=1 Tax=Neomoorella thermoacetica TaxID=1525 RepID=UPI0008FA09D4|nr:hypothetical protein [Moorella thermoacetica]OIQ10476.1 hypothetical protein MOOTH_26040 [Moorella thermoacetica]
MTTIKVQYFGVPRLLTGKARDVFSFPGDGVTLEAILAHIGEAYGPQVLRECRRYLIVAHDPHTGRQHRVSPGAEGCLLSNGWTLQFITPITGG